MKSTDTILRFEYWTRTGQPIEVRINISHETRVIRAREAA